MSTPTFPPIVPPDESARGRASQLRAAVPTSAGTPVGSLGRVEDLGSWLAACQSVAPPRPLETVRLLVVSGEPEVARDVPAISALPADFTQQARQVIEDGVAPIAEACRASGVDFFVCDAAADTPTGAIHRGDAMTQQQFDELLAKGMRIADEQADSGVDLLLLGDSGRGMTTIAAAVIGTICSIEPVKVIGWGSGIGDEGWKAKCEVLRDAMYRVRDDRAVAARVLRRCGSAELVVMAGVLAQAAVRRTPVVFDGIGAAAAAVCAQMLAPGASAWWRAAGVAKEPGHRPALKALGLEPVLDVGIGTGQGLGAVLTVPLLRLAVDVYGA
ncbi:MAG TPA: nicotinate-nucleotide--dimethylbenzimidazole phosphoribosyltransferase [Candidatus Corynebacterium gallistercoris]|uniref:Nicotinate-nucleotide--dimethylbenzimidazole phosphoribosyltransferase n=1 Tax=Candidatus Corynebacterium gallistercoris TaxID=2838530 RepID=A0A9D1S1L0_9CORY|nr:nicotinate-nucleotide--dimethylbenzimidazole phosphoribosyltransferase [Candidatus Corynebacterium gallistercoris]